MDRYRFPATDACAYFPRMKYLFLVFVSFRTNGSNFVPRELMKRNGKNDVCRPGTHVLRQPKAKIIAEAHGKSVFSVRAALTSLNFEIHVR